jgi:hypothetical protein
MVMTYYPENNPENHATNAPAYQNTPVIVAPAPQTYRRPACSGKTKALGFVGMGLAISGLVFSVLGLLYTFIGIAAEGILAFAFSFSFGMFSLPLSIVGRVLSNRSFSMGNLSAACSVGSKMGLAGIIVSAVMLFIGLIGLGI